MCLQSRPGQSRQGTPSMCACLYGRPEIVRVLIEFSSSRPVGGSMFRNLSSFRSVAVPGCGLLTKGVFVFHCFCYQTQNLRSAFSVSPTLQHYETLLPETKPEHGADVIDALLSFAGLQACSSISMRFDGTNSLPNALTEAGSRFCLPIRLHTCNRQ